MDISGPDLKVPPHLVRARMVAAFSESPYLTGGNDRERQRNAGYQT